MQQRPMTEPVTRPVPQVIDGLASSCGIQQTRHAVTPNHSEYLHVDYMRRSKLRFPGQTFPNELPNSGTGDDFVESRGVNN